VNRRKFPRHFENRILKILPDDFSKMQSTILLNEARKPYTENRDGKINRYKGMGHNTTSYYLKSLIKQGRVNKIQDSEDRRMFYYTKCKNPKTIVITEEAINAVKSMLEKLPEQINKSIEREFAYYKEFAEDLTVDEERNAYMEISEDRDKIDLIIASVLIKQAQKFIEAVFPSLKNKEYYIDSDYNAVPKALVDERITHDERMKFLGLLQRQKEG